jgi:hypothetical protein
MPFVNDVHSRLNPTRVRAAVRVRSIADVAREVKRASTTDVDVVYGTVRLIRRDVETFLPWARDDYACVVFNLHTTHDATGIARRPPRSAG